MFGPYNHEFDQYLYHRGTLFYVLLNNKCYNITKYLLIKIVYVTFMLECIFATKIINIHPFNCIISKSHFSIIGYTNVYIQLFFLLKQLFYAFLPKSPFVYVYGCLWSHRELRYTANFFKLLLYSFFCLKSWKMQSCNFPLYFLNFPM